MTVLTRDWHVHFIILYTTLTGLQKMRKDEFLLKRISDYYFITEFIFKKSIYKKSFIYKLIAKLQI